MPSTTYHVALAATIGDAAATRSWDFTTAAASKVLSVKLTPGDNATVGVGMPIVVKLNSPVADPERPVLEKRIVVTTNPPQAGAWHWFSPTELHWRPQNLWAAHTQVSVAANVAGFGSGEGAVAVSNVTTNWATGDAHISVVDSVKHIMAVSTNGVPVRLIKVSTGQAKYPTHSGVHVVSEKSPSVVMDSATVGIPRNSPDGYYETVKWDVRISNSGEFVHAAPWSVKSQGSSNVSHGCVNVSTADGEWFFNYSNPGEVVMITGTPLQLQPTNGIGDWQIPWAQWAD
jgi:lipoprotein-anchoring transpeptidase ErfK/SrfK